MCIKVVIFALFIVAVAVAQSYEYSTAEDGKEQQYDLLQDSLHREKRQTTIDIQKSGAGGRATLGHQGTVFNDGNNRLDGGAFVSKPFSPSGPPTVGGNLGYTHVPSGSNLNVGAQHTPGFGTNVQAQGVGNLWRSDNGNTRLDAVGSYGRSFGGPGGTGRPNYYGGLQFSHRF